MNIDERLQQLSTEIYEEPLSLVRNEPIYPDPANPLHLAVVLIDCDTEVAMNGMLGFLENSTGRYLSQTIEALEVIGALKSAQIFHSVRNCMKKHHVTWERLRGDFDGHTEYEITSFSELHGDELDDFANEVCEKHSGFDLFNTFYSPEDAYSMLLHYLERQAANFEFEISSRITKKSRKLFK